ncbi:MAG: hypothetical protein MJ238_05345 [Bacilli bacterium]|nr:hypothetical protein [Bacilli bacterium]
MPLLIKKNEIDAYVSGLIDNGSKPLKAKKIGYVLARPAIAGEIIVSYAGDGMNVEETTNTANDSDWVLTKSNPNGEPITSIDGKQNEWIISQETFIKKYEAQDKDRGLYRPISSVQVFLQIMEDIELESPWGSIEHLEAGAYLNITAPNDVYGIQEKDFIDTYEIIEQD